MPEVKHTPLPWRVLESNNSTLIHIETDEGNPAGIGIQIATINRGIRQQRLANAQLIVQSVNSHAQLVEALERAVSLLEATADFVRINPVKGYTVHYDEADCDGLCLKDDCEIAIEQARAALRAAGKE